MTNVAIAADVVKYLATTAAVFFGWKLLLTYWTARLPVFGCEPIPGLSGVTPAETEARRQDQGQVH